MKHPKESLKPSDVAIELACYARLCMIEALKNLPIFPLTSDEKAELSELQEWLDSLPDERKEYIINLVMTSLSRLGEDNEHK